MIFDAGTIVTVLLPNPQNSGYDYRLPFTAKLGDYISVPMRNSEQIGLIVGPGSATDLDASKIRNAFKLFDIPGMSDLDIKWLYKMSEYTMLKPGAILKLILNVPDAFLPKKMETLYSWSGNVDRMTEQRIAVSDAFLANPNESLSETDIKNISGVSTSVVRGLIQSGALIPTGSNVIETFTPHEYKTDGGHKLNDEQLSASSSVNINHGFLVHLLDGVTGSGKTQVYFDIVARAYASGKSVLIMMPEIALTAQFMNRFTERFGSAPIVWHSNLSSASRRNIWQNVSNGKIKMVIGTRSALFLPWQNLGLIIVDEEHDTSYKQEDMGSYHARDMAILRAHINSFPVVLASATPSAETIHKVQIGAYSVSHLHSRFGGATMPKIELIDLRQNSPAPINNQRTWLTEPLVLAMEQTLAKRQQSMLFINRRGYAPITVCQKCGHNINCPDCSIGMVYHQKTGKLQCHYCGNSAPVPTKCPNCGTENLMTHTGVGIERIRDEVIARFPFARVAILSSDLIVSPQSLERIISEIENHEIDIIIGTQILAKGHHFPNLTLVGVIDADMGLFGTDFRSHEKTFQQLYQVSGRSGRAEHPGRVLIQTYQPEHPVLIAIANNDRDGLMKNDLKNRLAASMPPFGQLISIIVECDDEKKLQSFCQKLSDITPIANGVSILGPMPAPMYKIRSWYRMRFLVTGGEKSKLQPIVEHWLNKIKIPHDIRLKIDVNPQSFS